MRCRFGTDRLRRDNSSSFENGIELVGYQIFENINCSGRPMDFNQVDLGGRSQPEVNSQIMLRKITASAVNLFRLAHATRQNFEPRADCKTIALGAGQFEAYPVSSRDAVI